MTATVWLGVDTMDFPQGGGHFWVYLNWALGLQGLGCRVVWLEPYEPDVPPEEVRARVRSLRTRLEPYGLADSIAVCPKLNELPAGHTGEGVPLEAAREADLLVNLAYYTHAALLSHFPRTAMVEIDPGLAQMWIDAGLVELPHYDLLFTTGETVAAPWQYAPPCVALDWWPTADAPADAPFTTVSSWHSGTWYTDGGDDWQPNNKRDGFLPFLDLPGHTSQPLELALALGDDEAQERAVLGRKGWRVVRAASVSSTPWDYQRYIQGSRGEFSCAKPSCKAFQNAWISDRTLCYLASGKPAVVEHTGPSRILPDAAGLFRFRTLDEAARHLETAASDYDTHCRLGRALVEEHFDAHKVVGSVLERSLG